VSKRGAYVSASTFQSADARRVAGKRSRRARGRKAAASLKAVDDLLTDVLAGRRLPRHALRLWLLMSTAAALYGAVCGMWNGARLAAYVALKLPLVLGVTWALTLLLSWLGASLLGLPLRFAAGGSAILLAAAKAPLVIGFTLLLCLPSLFVFGAMAGIEWTWRKLLVLASGFAGSLGLLLVGLLPIAWLFSVSSRYLVTAVWLHILLWLLALVFGWRFLRAALREFGARGAMLPWLLLFCLVSFQVATVLRPVLSREPGEPLFSGAKMSFFENLGRALDLDDKQEKERKTAASPAPRPR
jgi:hypothetical protein